MNWIKMRTDLNDDPAVVQMASKLKLDEFAVVGRLHRLWSWADHHTTDGKAIGISPKWIDRYVSRAGFAQAMADCGWLIIDGETITFPKFEVHNGASAKSRADATTRQRGSRSRHVPVTTSCDNGHTYGATKASPEKNREEKIREEGKDPLTPASGGIGAGDKNCASKGPTTEAGKRIAALYHRKPDTPWSDKEKAAFRKLMPIELDNLAKVEAYTEAERAKGDEGRHRRDLLTFLNNFRGELDRANAMANPTTRGPITKENAL